MKILFKCPSRGRPKKFKINLDKYYSMMSNQCEYEFIITLDNDDVLMNTPEMRRYLDSKPNLKYFFGDSKTKIEAVNANMENVEFDILVLVSDDMVPVVDSYDKVIVQQMKKHFPDTDGALHFNDGKYGRKNLNTLSIMGKKLYDYFGYIYHPAYKSVFCDKEYTRVIYKLEKVVYIPDVIIKHNWTGGKGADATYRRGQSMSGKDMGTFNGRATKGFPK